MNGEAADLVFTDPHITWQSKATRRSAHNPKRQHAAADFRLFLERAFRACRGALKPGASVYVCHSSSWQREFQDALETPASKCDARSSGPKTHSPGFRAHKSTRADLLLPLAGQSDAWYGDKSQSTLWAEKKPRRIACIRR